MRPPKRTKSIEEMYRKNLERKDQNVKRKSEINIRYLPEALFVDFLNISAAATLGESLRKVRTRTSNEQQKNGRLFQPSFEKPSHAFFVFFLGNIVDVSVVRAVDQIQLFRLMRVGKELFAVLILDAGVLLSMNKKNGHIHRRERP